MTGADPNIFSPSAASVDVTDAHNIALALPQFGLRSASRYGFGRRSGATPDGPASAGDRSPSITTRKPWYKPAFDGSSGNLLALR